MKKNVLALSIAAMVGGLGFAGAANAALNVNESGTGHILIMPYYTAQNGNMSVFHLTNTDQENGKAVKVRFRGASNSDDVLDFQVFLSPGDVWTAAVTQNPDTGLAQLTTADNSCTYPNFFTTEDANGQPLNGTVPFVTDRLTSHLWDTDAKKAEQTLEGYVEILTMANIPANTDEWTDTTKADPRLFTAIKHVNGVAPCTASVLAETLTVTADDDSNAGIDLKSTAAWRAANPTTTIAADLAAPSAAASLVGQWYVMNVEQTTTYSAAMPAITADAPLNVFSPQRGNEGAEVLVDGVAGTGVNASPLLTADPLLAYGIIEQQFYDVPDLSTPYETGTTAATQASNLTGAIARAAVMNQFASDAAVDAKTDWVFSMPTRRYAIAANYAAVNTLDQPTLGGVTTGTTAPNVFTTENTVTAAAQKVPAGAAGYRVVNPGVVATGAAAGVDNVFTAEGTTGNLNGIPGGLTTVNADGQICVAVPAANILFTDREETTAKAPADRPVFSPGTPSKPNDFNLCGEVSVLAFSADESALGAKLSRQSMAVSYMNGWGQLSAPTDTVIPLLGSGFIKLSNPSARPGVSGTYGITWAHAYN